MSFGVAQVIWFGLARSLPPQASTFAITAVPLVGTLSTAFVASQVPGGLDFLAAGFFMPAIAIVLLPVQPVQTVQTVQTVQPARQNARA